MVMGEARGLPSPRLSLQDWQIQGPREEGGGMDQGSLAPLLHLADEETDSAAVSALLGGMGQVCAERGWTEQNPSLEDAAAMLVTNSMEPWTDSRPGDRAPGPDSDSATHRVTLGTSCPSLGSSCSSSMTRGLD